MSNDSTPDTEALWSLVATERRRLADDLERLDDRQWASQSQCDAWTVEELASHVVTPFETSNLRFMGAMLRARGDFDKAIIRLTARVHRRHSRLDAVRKLREHAENRWTPPKVGPAFMLAEIVVPSQDVRRPLDLDHDIPAETIDIALRDLDDAAMQADYAQRIGVPVPTAG